MTTVFVDADACPVKNEVYRVAGRHGCPVKMVANSRMAVPNDATVELVVVGDGFDEADDWIVERVEPDDVVVTDDIPLAARCLKKGARALTPKGRVFSEASIGEALASREVLSQLREEGLVRGGPPAYRERDRSAFLQRLDETLHACRRGRG